MAYCGQATRENARYLSNKTGLDPDVALAWLWNECQSIPNPTNPLNIIYGQGTRGRMRRSGSRFAEYRSTQAGLDDAAWLINNSPYYAGIRRAIRSGNPALQARAIELSPWAGGHYGGAKHTGGISRRWAQMTRAHIDWSKVALKRGGGFSPEASAPTAFGGLVTFPEGHILTREDVDGIMTKLREKGMTGPFDIGGPGIHAVLESEIGKPWNRALLNDLQSKLGTAATEAKPAGLGVPDIPGAIAGIGDTATKLVSYLLAVVIIVAGLWLYARGQRSKVEVIPSGGLPVA